MENNGGDTFDRRAVLKTSAMALGGWVLAGERTEAFPRAVNTNSGPSKLKITDLRVATVVKPGPSPCALIRIDTDQGVYGLGEVRDGASATYALFLKSRILGENPLQIDIPIRIGNTTIMPGDLVVGDREGVYFIPPEFVKSVLDQADEIHIHDEWTKKKFAEGKYKSSEVYPSPSDPKLQQEYKEYLNKELEEIAKSEKPNKPGLEAG